MTQILQMTTDSFYVKIPIFYYVVILSYLCHLCAIASSFRFSRSAFDSFSNFS